MGGVVAAIVGSIMLIEPGLLTFDKFLAGNKTDKNC